jgi:hypothetical protein
MVEAVIYSGKSEEVAHRMQGNGSPELACVDVDKASVDAEYLCVKKLEELLHHLSFEHFSRQMSFSVQRMRMSYIMRVI